MAKSFKRILNFRVSFFLFVLGIFCVYFSYRAVYNKYFLFVFIIPILFLIHLIIKKRFKVLTLFILFLTFVSCFSFIYFTTFDSKIDYKPVTITAKVDKISAYGDYAYVTLKNARAFDENLKEIKLNGNIRTSVSFIDGELNFSLYDTITFESKLKSLSPLDENGVVDTYLIKDNIKYKTSSVDCKNITKLYSSPTLAENIREYNRQILIQNFGEKKGNLVYAVLYGDKTFTDKDVLEDFKYSGVAHIFSVSGLHVSLIVLLLSFILKKLKVNKIVNLIINSIFLFAFCYLCDFTPSVLRASIMAIFFSLTLVMYSGYDILSSLSFAGCILLFINPMYVFDIGFLLSFLCIFGIIMVTKLTNKIVLKVKFVEKILKAAFVSIGAQLAIFPIYANFYGFLPTWSILSNIVIIPLFSIFYSIFFLTNIVVLVLPFMAFLYKISSFVLDTVIFFNSLIVSLPFTVIYISNLTLTLSILLEVALYFTSLYVLFNKKLKIISSIMICVVMTISVILCCMEKISYEDVFNLYNESSLNVLYESDENSYFLINPDLSKSEDIAKTLKSKKIFHLNGIIYFEEQNFESSQIIEDLGNFNPSFYLPKGYNAEYNLVDKGYKVVEIDEEEIFVEKGFSFKLYNYKGSPHSLTIKINNKTFGFFYGENLITFEMRDFLKNNFNFTFDYAILKDDTGPVKYKDFISSKVYYTENDLVSIKV